MSLYLSIDISRIISMMVSHKFCSFQPNNTTLNIQKFLTQGRIFFNERGSGRDEM